MCGFGMQSIVARTTNGGR
uniref:Uncharacterized protein n=1 Tax=Anguilla anguilla TaxID=7936 RepID=A0A0E9RHZ8_ANGAN